MLLTKEIILVIANKPNGEHGIKVCLVNESSGSHKQGPQFVKDLSEQIRPCLFVHYLEYVTMLGRHWNQFTNYFVFFT